MKQIHGVPFSAHTRKVIIAARHKHIAFELVPVVPLDPPPGWAHLSPLGKIPVLVDGEFSIPDSSVICDHFEQLVPSPPLYPRAPRARARALWLEEYIDGALAHDILHGVLMPLKIAPALMGKDPDHEAARPVIEDVIPPKLRYLESVIEGEFVVGSHLTVADITLLSILVNYLYAGVALDSFTTLTRWLRGVLRHPSVGPALRDEAEAAAKLGLDRARVDTLLHGGS